MRTDSGIPIYASLCGQHAMGIEKMHILNNEISKAEHRWSGDFEQGE